jgi:NIMA (never in mitosis gene a)-related kinase
MVGTPYYISPEIVSGKAYSFKTDVWSMGIILHELCSLQVPINASNLHNLYMRITDDKVPIRPIPS